jgi:hypothetical protein
VSFSHFVQKFKLDETIDTIIFRSPASCWPAFKACCFEFVPCRVGGGVFIVNCFVVLFLECMQLSTISRSCQFLYLIGPIYLVVISKNTLL